MLARTPIAKASRFEAQILERETRVLKAGFRRFVQGMQQSRNLHAALRTGDVESVLRVLDLAINGFAATWVSAFIDTGNQTVRHLSGKLKLQKARPTVALAFDVVDPVAVRLMDRNKLRLVTALTQQQRNLIRPILVRGIQQGLGPAAIARQLRTVVGLSDQGAKAVQAFERAQMQARAQELELPEAERGPTLNDQQIADRVERVANSWRRNRADAIARTESTRIVGQAQDQAVRQSIKAVGQRGDLTGKMWNATHDERTRHDHVDADGQRRRLDEPFDVGGEQIDKPGDGSARNAVNCRCVLTYEFLDTQADMDAWLAAGP